MRAAWTRARFRCRPSPRSWPNWWSGRGTRSAAAAGATASSSTFPSTCRARWPTAGASCRCSTTSSPTPPGMPRSRPPSGSPRCARTLCRGLDRRRGARDRAGAAVAHLRQARRSDGRLRPRARDLQGAGGSPWRAHPGRERRSGPGHHSHLHPARGRGVGAEAATEPPRAGNRPRRSASWWSTTTRACCAPCATRWPGPATPRWCRRAGRSRADHPQREAPAGAARPGAAGAERHRG